MDKPTHDSRGCRPKYEMTMSFRRRWSSSKTWSAKKSLDLDLNAERERGPFEGGSKACGCVEELADYGCVTRNG
jgi:hypothetical protein